MNEFERDVQSKRNDLIDSVVGFVVPFAFFTIIMVVATVIEVAGGF
ncbi:YqzM family protein [Salibacterium lacus]|uniref:YqzM family protein n=1 Tax=Salibacterium lacus TaxID=1898109 RepID=A0ABW5SZR0_9BACI